MVLGFGPSGSPGEVVKKKNQPAKYPCRLSIPQAIEVREPGHWATSSLPRRGRGDLEERLAQSLRQDLCRPIPQWEVPPLLDCLALDCSKLPWGFQLVQVGEQVGRASLGTAAGPPALGPGSAPSPWPGYADSSRRPLSPRVPVWAEEEWESQSPALEKGERCHWQGAICLDMCEFVLGGVHRSVWACVSDMSELVDFPP